MDTKPALASSLVEEFVRVAHSDLERTQELLEQESGLANASWDWGGGDFESALGAAAHMGRKDIANYLLDNGARLDLFAATMLGKYEIVKSTLDSYPATIHIPGPHNISLLEHAKFGGEDANAVFGLLQSLLQKQS
ncbi:MAG: ankyrin repeat domain-containing protein [Chloroflexota bacterium]|nr:ankyrin repeat domain-containing protein [Chloroflexota bacterium]